MNDELVIITPELTPAAGGVGDYTLRLLENWPNPSAVTALVAHDTSVGISPLPYRVSKLGSDSASILEQLPVSGGKVLVQYSAYGFDRFGYPGKLIRALTDWKQNTGGRLVVMFHEIWAFWPITNKNFFIQFLHRRAIKRLLNVADEVFTSTKSQAEHLLQLSPTSPIYVLPVGSNIRRNEIVDPVRIPGCTVLFGLQRTRIRALEKMQSTLSSLARAGRITKIISVGAGDDRVNHDKECALLASLPLERGFEQRGQRPEREISELLFTSSFGISAQDELSFSKSGTFMACAAHELNILADFTDPSKAEPICWLIAPEELLGGISDTELKTRAQRLSAWQRENSSWELIAGKFGEALNSKPNAIHARGDSKSLKQMKLLLVSPCQGAYGGIEAFVLAVAAAVRREPDFDVRICFKKVRSFALHPSLAVMLRHEAVMFVDRAGSELADAIKWADIVHLQNASPDVVALAKFFGKRVVLTIHNYMRQGWSLHTLLWRLGAAMADARWYNSNFVWNTWESRKRRGSRKVPTTSKLPEGWVPPNERTGFVFIGRWIANKGIETLVDAYLQADLDRPQWPLRLMGDGPLRPAIQARIDNQPASGIRIEGFVDEATKAQHMRKARWIVVPPHTNEDFGLTAIEARNLGVPCIITRDGGLPEAGGRQALICEPGDPRALADLLEQASKMSETEYAERATRTREELAGELEPMDFYAHSYRRILRGEPLD